MTRTEYEKILNDTDKLVFEPEAFVGKTIKYIFADGDVTKIVATDGTFYIGENEADYYNRYRYSSRKVKFDDICMACIGATYVNWPIMLTEFGKAINADLDICREIVTAERDKAVERDKARRLAEYEKLHAEFGDPDKEKEQRRIAYEKLKAEFESGKSN